MSELGTGKKPACARTSFIREAYKSGLALNASVGGIRSSSVWSALRLARRHGGA